MPLLCFAMLWLFNNTTIHPLFWVFTSISTSIDLLDSNINANANQCQCQYQSSTSTSLPPSLFLQNHHHTREVT
ncbi:hypothetical protein P153DRAFT_369094 [Dothidotthia symphoricarpi CBS 119687]|uniref:Secreted protein n=1 Tax=Dothidotthia symphoricarpi CBS 119687 TaxID=1392245 RepID=A0A6A6A6I2_9PLEO|nr:uncharacterized protein P153DRAFT_369094 [Dothidotthia symphoricarpi CBS 119687]KAF2126378.1 hypothetical protein P153DRAFT_369094 [Dothidotthia symphoricarpi CBS 119687]